ncbi:MAG TPA: ABC transporter substrate-binding protein [Anaerolineae bacterium]|nr:ABC transporter substrate-binding protein [Anaerolineae bacterium]
MKRQLFARKSILILALIAIAMLVLAACAPTALPTAAPPTSAGTGPTSAPAATNPPAATSAPSGGATATPPPPTPNGGIIFHSSQFSPVNEAETFRNVILKDSPVLVDFQPQATGPFVDIVMAQQKAGKINISIIGGQHGDFPAFVNAGIMDDLTPLLNKLADRKFPDAYVTLGKMGTDKQYYIPWAQATYIMVANKDALQYLPQGADINNLTYTQLTEWAKNAQAGTGQRVLGLPLGPQGLIHRFWQGYLYPSYTGTEVSGFKSADAVKMWTDFKELWKYVNPSSTNYNNMADPLQSGEVMIAWDHIARLKPALDAAPDKYVAFPAPSGPKGLAYMPVLTGLGIPVGAPNRDQAEQVITYLTQPSVQTLVAQNLGFFPVVQGADTSNLPPGTKLEADAIAKMQAAPNALPALLPVGLGAKGGDWNKAYNDTFTRIVLKNEDIQTVLNEQGAIVQQILNDTKAPCWSPDPPSSGPCQVK